VIDEAAFIICVTILIVLFIGDPDLHDLILAFIEAQK